MTDEELARLKVRINSSLAYGAPVTGWLAQSALRLIVEVARLRAENADQATIINELTPAVLALKDENAALREIAQAVTDMDLLSGEARVASGVPSGMRHADLIARARALLEGARG